MEDLEKFTEIQPWRRYICVQGYSLEELSPDGNAPVRQVIRLRYTELDGREGWYTFSASRQPNSKWAKHLKTLQAVGLSPLPNQPNTAVGHYLLVEERETGRGDFLTTYPAVLEDFGVGAEGHECALEAMRQEGAEESAQESAQENAQESAQENARENAEDGGEKAGGSASQVGTPKDETLRLAYAIRRIAGNDFEAFARQWAAAGFDAETAEVFFNLTSA